MSFSCSVELKALNQEHFHAVDKEVMRHAFGIHNSVGRFCEERVYQEELAHRCRSDGVAAHREASLRVSHGTFAKTYFADLVIGRGSIYEIKTADALTSNHQRQLINYLLLAGLHHGKLINFRTGSVESRFVSTRLNHDDRTIIEITDNAWHGSDSDSERLRQTLIALLTDWGAFLEACLYRSALVHLLSGPQSGVRRVAISIGGRVAGEQTMCLLNPNIAWHLSAIRLHLAQYEAHIRRLLAHTDLEKIHWINLDHRTVTLKTLRK